MDHENQVTPPEEEVLQTTQPEEIPAAEAAPAQFGLNVPQEEQPKPKKKTGLILGIVAAVAAVALALGLIFGLGGKGSASDPHTAMISAQQEALYSLADGIAAGRNNLSATVDATAGKATQGTFHLLLSESILDRLELMASQYGAELDLSFLQDIAISLDLNSQDLLVQYKLGLGLGDKEITYLDYIMDMEKGAMYMGLPELSPNYAATEGVAVSTVSPQMQKIQEAYETFAESLPSREALQSCLRSYVDLMLEQLKEPTIGEESVTIGEVTQTMTTVTYRLTEAQIFEFYKTCVVKLKADETVKQFMEAYADYMTAAMEGAGETSAEVFESYEEALQKAITQLDTLIAEAKDGNYIDLIGYLDAKQDLRGYKLVAYTEGEAAVAEPLRWITLEDGDKELVEIVLYSDVDQELLTVTGTQRTVDGVYNGSFKLAFPDRKSLTVELMDMTMDPFLKGSIQLTPNTNLLKEIVGDSYTTLRILGANLGLRLDIEGGAEAGSFGFHFTSDGSSLIGITVDASMGTNDPITLPEESNLLTGEDAMDQLLEGLDLEKLLEKLEATGVPSDLVELLEAFVFMPEDLE